MWFFANVLKFYSLHARIADSLHKIGKNEFICSVQQILDVDWKLSMWFFAHKSTDSLQRFLRVNYSGTRLSQKMTWVIG